MKQKIYIEIIRNMMNFLNLRYDYNIKKSMNFFQKVYDQYKDVHNFQNDSINIKNIDDFIRANLNEYMPSQISKKKKEAADENNIDNAIFFDSKGVFIG